jgi:tetratricopeptide (TPR) repeat protein
LQADDQADCKPILEKAVKALGGEKKLAQLVSGSLKARFVISAYGKEAAGSIESIWQGPEKCIFEIKASGNQENGASFKIVLNGENMQQEEDGTIISDGSNDSGQDVIPMRAIISTVCLPQLLGNLAKKDSRLSHLGELKLKDCECVGIRMSVDESTDINVFFEKSTGLPTKAEIAETGPESRGGLIVLNYGEYKEFDGLKHPSKVIGQASFARSSENDLKRFEFTTQLTEIKAEDNLAEETFTIKNMRSPAQIHTDRGDQFGYSKDYAKAISEYEEAIRLNPKEAVAYDRHAWLLSTCPEAKFRDGKRAVKLGMQACELSEWKNPIFLDTLAAAYAEIGDFNVAMKWQRRAIELFKEEDVKQAKLEMLKLYEKHKPYREEVSFVYESVTEPPSSNEEGPPK